MSYYHRSFLSTLRDQGLASAFDLLTGALKNWADIPTDAMRGEREKTAREALFRVAAMGGDEAQQAYPQLEKSLNIQLPKETVTDYNAPTELARSQPDFSRTMIPPGSTGGMSFPRTSPMTGEPFYGTKQQYAPMALPIDLALAAEVAKGKLAPLTAKKPVTRTQAQEFETQLKIQKLIQDMKLRPEEAQSKINYRKEKLTQGTQGLTQKELDRAQREKQFDTTHGLNVKKFELSEKAFANTQEHQAFLEEMKAAEFAATHKERTTAYANAISRLEMSYELIKRDPAAAKANVELRQHLQDLMKQPVPKAPVRGGGKQVQTPETGLPTGWKFTGKVINGEREIVGPDGKLGVWGRVEK